VSVAPRITSGACSHPCGNQRGFTLIEVLIAATITFAVIAVASTSYSTSLAASRRAEALVTLLTPMPLITNNIRNALREKPLEILTGSAELLGVKYRFEARTAKYGAPPRRFDPDQAQFRDYKPRFRLYDVHLFLESSAARREYIYQELAWEPAEL
jgi:prepilin-type N-terminal cleavage/methylation domain-containing protein